MDYSVVYNPTEFIQQSVDEVVRTLYEAIGLVVVVVIVFLQTWRAAIIRCRNPDLVDRLFSDNGRRRDHVQHALAVRPRARDRHRRRRRHRRGGECRTLSRQGMTQAGRAQDDGRGRECPAGDRARALRRVHPDRLHQRPTGLVLPAVRRHNRCGDGDLLLCLPYPLARARGDPPQAA